MAAPATWWMKIDSELLNSTNLEVRSLPLIHPTKKPLHPHEAQRFFMKAALGLNSLSKLNYWDARSIFVNCSST